MLSGKRILVAAMLLSAAACGNDRAGGPQGAPPEVTVEPPRVETVTEWSVYTGRFEAIEAVDVRARVSGYLEEVHFEDGADVKKGDLLFTIDRRPFDAALAAAQGELAETKATLAQARKERARAEQLIDIGGVSQEELDALAAAAARAEAALEATKARVRLAELDVEFTQVRAPISGRISERRIDPGNLIAGGGAGADILTTIVSDDPIHFAFEASEGDVLAYLTGQRRSDPAEIEIKLLGEKEYSWKGNVTFADNRVDPGSGTLKLRATIDNKDGVLRPGLFGEARVNAFEPYQAVTVPETAIVADASRRLVYVVGAENKVEPRAVELGPLVGDRRVVRSGVDNEDRVVVSGLQRARPGAPVKPVEKEEKEPSKLAADRESHQ